MAVIFLRFLNTDLILISFEFSSRIIAGADLEVSRIN